MQIVTAAGRLPQLLKAEIEEQVNPTYQHAEKLFVMTISFNETEIAEFINPDGTSSRGDMHYQSTYSLTRKLDGKLIDTGTLIRISSYNVSENADYGTYVSRDDARKRAVIELAQDYKLRLANLLPKLNNPNTPAVVTPDASGIPIVSTKSLHEDHPTGL